MASTLVQEDGSGVAGANSYTTLEDAREFLALRGLAISSVDATAEQQLLYAMDVIEALRAEFQGVKVSATQPLQWPRSGAYLDGFEIAPDAIPAELAQAQAMLAYYANAGVDLQPSGDGAEMTAASVGPISVSFLPGGSSNPQPALTRARVLLEPLLDSGAEGAGLVTERV